MKKIFSVWTFLGICLGFGLFGWAVHESTDNFAMFFSAHAFVLVFGGTFAASMIAFHSRYVMRTLYQMAMIFIPCQISPKSLADDVKQIISWARLYQKDGAKVMDQLRKTKLGNDPFLKFGFEMLSAGYKGDQLRKNLNNMVDTCYFRDMIQVNIANTMSGFAPAFGMIATLLGLVIMFENMGGDISKIGPGMAIALLGTLYGVVFAQLIFKPAAEKIQQTNEIIRFRNRLVTEGLMMISEGKNAYEIQDGLNSFLHPSVHIDLAKEKSGSPAKQEG